MYGVCEAEFGDSLRAEVVTWINAKCCGIQCVLMCLRPLNRS